MNKNRLDVLHLNSNKSGFYTVFFVILTIQKLKAEFIAPVNLFKSMTFKADRLKLENNLSANNSEILDY